MASTKPAYSPSAGVAEPSSALKSTEMINTKKVRDRRKLRFESAEDVLRDAELLVEAARRGTLRATGNWSLGQALAHLATWVNMPFDGYPEMPRPAWWMRLLRPLITWWLVNKGFPAGVRIAGVPGGTFGIVPCESDEGLERLREAFARLATEAPTQTSPAFGSLTREEWIKFHLRHAELHLSFFHPE
jgi:hypothetical protein